LGNTSSENIPRPIRALLSRKVVIAACSYHHTVILCSDGSLFSCGRNDSGQLGHGDTVDKKTPQAVLSAPKNIVSISCGQFHTVACTSQGIVYACGKNDYGQLGLDGTPSLKFFTKIPMPSDLDNVAQVCCGYYHTLVLSTNGMVGGFGRNDYGQVREVLVRFEYITYLSSFLSLARS
jgi:RCC1 and BTB domain-containing protein